VCSPSGVQGGELYAQRALDAVEQLVVGVAEGLDALALELSGDSSEVDPGVRGRGERPYGRLGIGVERGATSPWSANACSV
jgi:hypothetical protein